MGEATEVATLWLVGGAPGAGKSTVARELVARLRPAPALLDKDTIFNPLVSEMLSEHGLGEEDREGPWYLDHIRPYEYSGLFSLAREIRLLGCAAVVPAPLTSYGRSYDAWKSLCTAAGGGDIRLLWVQSDEETLRARLASRGAERDASFVNRFEQLMARIEPSRLPEVGHLVVDNRIGAPSIGEQLTRLLDALPD